MARQKKSDAEKVQEAVDSGVEAQKVDTKDTTDLVNDQKVEVQEEAATEEVAQEEESAVGPLKVEETPVHEAHHLDVAETKVDKSEEAEPEEVDKAALKQAIEDMRANEEELAKLQESAQEPQTEEVAPKTRLKKNRGQDVHGTGLKSDRSFYFGGPHSRRR